MALDDDQHLKAGEIYGLDATCGGLEKKKKKKIDYKSRESASKAARAMMRKGSKPLEPYPCFWCGGWHIGREMQYEEYKGLIREYNKRPNG